MPISSIQKHRNQKDDDLLSPDIVDIKTRVNESQGKNQIDSALKEQAKKSPSPPKLSVNSSRKSIKKTLDKE